MTPFSNYMYLSSNSNCLEEEDPAADIFPSLEESRFCSNFQCCGRSLKDLHELLQHYEEKHVKVEDADDDHTSNSSLDVETVAAADSLLHVGVNALNRPFSARPLSVTDAKGLIFGANGVNTPISTPAPSLKRPELSKATLSPSGKRTRVLTLGIETCDFADNDHERLSAFDNTVIRPVDASRLYNYHSYPGYARIAPKRSQSVPALPNIPFINGEGGFKLIHSILSSTVDPPAGDASMIFSSSGNGIFSSSQSSGHQRFSSFSSSDRPFICPVSGCGKTYKNANGLKYHAIHGHDGVLVEKPHICPFEGCGKRYKNSNGLKYHFQHAHPDTQPPSSNISRALNLVRPTNYPSSSTSSSTSSSANSSSEDSESIQGLLASAPATIANLIKRNPMIKQHLPTILKSLQKINSNNLQKSTSSEHGENSNNQL